MKKNRKIESRIIRNNNYFNTIRNYRVNANNLSKMKYHMLKTSNIINEYKKLSKTKIKSDIKLNKTNSVYKRNNTVDTNKNSINDEIILNNKKLKDKNNIFKNKKNIYIKNQNISSKQNNFYNYDSEHSSMDTIKKILYNTDNKKEAKKDNFNNLLKNTKVDSLQIINNFKTLNQKEEKNITSYDNKINNNSKKSDIINIDSYNSKINITNGNNIIDKNLINKINKELKINSKRLALQSMKFLKTNNNYDFDNNDNSINLSDEFNNILEENEKNNKIFNQNNNNYTYRKINNNINININNNNIKNNNKNNKKIQNLKINKGQLINNNLSNNFIDIDENFSDDNNKTENTNEIINLQEKIKELKEEINNKNILINEYSTLAQKSKLKFEQLITNNKKIIQEIKNDNNYKIMLYKSKIVQIEKERQKIMNKYLENKKYNEFLEGVLFTKNNNEINNNININLDGKIKIKYLEEIVKKLLKDISAIKIELENKNKENEKLKNIIIKYKEYKDNRNYRAISNPRKNSNINLFDKAKNMRLITKNGKWNKNEDLSSNLILNSKIFSNKINISKKE